MMPSAFVVLGAFPLNPNGKLDRAALPAPSSERPDLTEKFVQPRNPLEETLAAIWSDVLHVERVGVHDNFFELGGHSLLAVRLFARLEETLGERPPLAALFRAPTVAELAELLQKGQEPPVSPVVVPLQTRGDKRPLFFVPDVSGLGFVFVDLVRNLGAERPFYALQSRGLVGQTLHTSIEAMATDYVEGVRTIQRQGPYMLGGFSMGGSIAYEMAYQLRAQGEEVSFLALLDSACSAFTVPPNEASDWDDLVFTMGLRLDGGTLERLVMCRPDELTPDDVIRVVESGLIPPGVGSDELRLMLDVFKANFRAIWEYRPQPQSCRLTFFRASEPSSSHPLGLDLGWGQLAPVDVHVVPGFHHNLVKEPHARMLAERLRACVETVEQQADRAIRRA
jgi:thioesterase domain-containing protein/acyl carrier protein